MRVVEEQSMKSRTWAAGAGAVVLTGIGVLYALGAFDPAVPSAAGADSPAVEPIRVIDKVLVASFDKCQAIEHPWGTLRWLVTSKADPAAEMTLGVVEIKPHQMNPLHMHPNCAEYLYVLEGSCEHLVGDKWVRLRAGDVARIPRAVQHKARTRAEAVKAVVVYDRGDRQSVQLGEGVER